ncbi:MAG TPA: anaerobic ribonucleoside-triphosphate reductase activating protein [Casimicrobiaceae bacterium]|nr:anaerobic ribonucleoside-triphosphate reductase activating protein [Casimicrobiaceae bacterium]
MSDDALLSDEPFTSLRVGGFVPFSSSDYPDALAAVVFCQGCPWRCRYCHNPHLIGPHGPDERDFARIVAWLRSRVGLLDAVVFSGGEPTAQPALADAARTVRALGFRVGLHTGGAYPRRLARVLSHVDWVGLDVKAPSASYGTVTGVRGSGASAAASLDIVLRSGVACELRTTVHPDVTPGVALEQVARELASRGVTRWTLQRFRAEGCADRSLVERSRADTIVEAGLLARLAQHVPAISVR